MHIYSQMRRAQLENLSGPPAGVPLGRIYLDITSTTRAAAQYYDGTAWTPFGSAFPTSNTTATATFNPQGRSETIYNTSASTLATLALGLPATSLPGQLLTYITNGIVTALTVSAAGNIAIGAAITSMTAKQCIIYQAVDASGTFVRLQ